MEKSKRKEITFDLNDKNLRKYYPKNIFSGNPQYHKKAWKDMAKFMKENGFEHRQYSVYVSKDKLTSAKVVILVNKMVSEMPWLKKCLNAMDVTDIGIQHDLMQAVEKAPLDYEIIQEKDDSRNIISDLGRGITKEKGETLDSWKEEIAKERAKDKGTMKSGTEKSHSKSFKER